jgi:hypothetical protein
MKNIKQIREQFDLITEKEEKEDRKLSALVRAGLYDAKKLPALKKALEKSADKITSQEKRMLLNLLDSLISQVVSDDQVYRKVRQNVHNVTEAKMDTYSKFDPRYKAGWPTDKEMPSVLILKRKAIRVYPDNQKVALYYSQALDKYVTIPYNDIQTGLNEAKKNDKDDEKKKKYYIKPRKFKRDKSIPKDGSVSDTKDLIQGKGQYKSKLSRANQLRRDGFNIGGILGIMMHDNAKKERVNASLAKVKARMDKTRSSEPVKEAPAAFVPKSKPAAPKAKATTGNTSTIRKKSPAATKAAMNKILKKNPKATFSKGASNQAGIAEDFKHNLSVIRESKQLNEQEQVNEIWPYLAVAATGLRAAAGAATRALPGLTARGAAARGAAGTAARAGKGAAGKAGRGARGKWLRRAGRLGALGALAGSLGGGSGSGSNASDSPASRNYDFKAKPGLKNSFVDYKAPSDTTIRQTDYQLNKKAQKAMMGESNVLDTIKSIVENDISEQTIRFNENEITINNTVAKKLLNVYESVNKTNKKKMEQMLNESATSFNKVLTFAVRQ